MIIAAGIGDEGVIGSPGGGSAANPGRKMKFTGKAAGRKEHRFYGGV